MAQLLLLTNALAPSSEVLPALGLLPHQVRVLPAEAAVLVDAPPADVVVVDGRRDLAGARSLCRLLRTTGLSSPLLLALTEGGMAAVAADWGADDVVLDTAGPAEVEARLRLALGRSRLVESTLEPESAEIRAGDVVIDESSYSARVRGRILDLTYKEFELLKFLAQHPGRVFTRAQLLQEVWGYDYFGGTRTVDVHVRPAAGQAGRRARGPDRHRAQRRVPVRAAGARPLRRRRDRRRLITGIGPGTPDHVARARVRVRAMSAEAVPPSEARVVVEGRLDADTVALVEALLADATEADGVQPLSEHVWLHLRHGGEGPDQNLLVLVPAPGGGPLIAGYAHLDPTDPVAGPSAEVVVHPVYRGRGLGRLLVETALAQAPGHRLRLWAHGDHPAARALATSLGFSEVRRLEQWRHSLQGPLPEAPLPAGVRLRAFRPGDDDSAWLALQRRGVRRSPPNRAPGRRRTSTRGWPRSGSTRRASCWRRKRPPASSWASTGRRSTAATGTPTGTGTSPSARCTSSGSRPRTRAAVSGEP
jgi:DNA-binding response OmpR family regulator/GNAT superfamily N-acetyltransferase